MSALIAVQFEWHLSV